jgi:cytidine deaminase
LAATSRVVAPCGSCRKLIAEGAQLANSNIRVTCCNGQLTGIVVLTIAELLPSAFGPEDLAVGRNWPALREELRSCGEQLIAIRRKQ